MRTQILALAIASLAAACGGGGGGTRVVPNTELSNTVTPSPGSLDCAVDPAPDATRELACARDALAHLQYDDADRRASNVMIRFPYSKRAIDAEELRGDIAVARKNWGMAYGVFSEWARKHPNDPHAPAVRTKLDLALKHINGM